MAAAPIGGRCSWIPETEASAPHACGPRGSHSLEASDFDNALFKRHGTYDDEIVEKARNTKAMVELNKKIWRLRRRYSNIIVDEVMENKKVTEVKED